MNYRHQNILTGNGATNELLFHLMTIALESEMRGLGRTIHFNTGSHVMSNTLFNQRVPTLEKIRPCTDSVSTNSISTHSISTHTTESASLSFETFTSSTLVCNLNTRTCSQFSVCLHYQQQNQARTALASSPFPLR